MIGAGVRADIVSLLAAGVLVTACRSGASTTGTCPVIPPGARCQVDSCAPGLVCQFENGCPSYYLPSFDRRCSTDPECLLVLHSQSCCMSVQAAVRVDEHQHFDEVEEHCVSAQTPKGCGCSGFTVTEDGLSPGAGQSIAAACVAGTCKAIITGRLQCGTTTCAPGDSCCATPGDGGACVFSCATSCVPATNDAGALIGCGGRVDP